MKQNKTVKIVAFLGLFGIIISIVGTGALALYEIYRNGNQQETTLTNEQLEEILQKTNLTSTGISNISTGVQIVPSNSGTGEIFSELSGSETKNEGGSGEINNK